ncbi:PREDICTED: homocysteine S-methyltransferase-like [Dinoponera quadriceps]|uniref:Homocysteine S-methyltransferase-like n=1 Tax=Dinoponera quadriceps TaxID=609295 RepID=A0A6P3WYY8_DINQU|nr:PREDICTED: homocysteine S-methyltransferase-like [Dinoponera quadriceps]
MAEYKENDVGTSETADEFSHNGVQESKNRSLTLASHLLFTETNKLNVLDGDFGAELRRHFEHAGKFGKAFMLHALKVDTLAVYQTHLAYLRAGARIIRTNTYQASKDDFMTYIGFDDREYSSMVRGAAVLAKKAVKTYGEEMGYDPNSEVYQLRRPLVAGSCGSYLLSLLDNIPNKWYISVEVLRELSESELLRFHGYRVQELLAAKVDLLAFESVPTVNEVRAVLKLLRNYQTTRAWISLLCSVDAKLMDGTDFEVAAAMCYNYLPNQIIAVGAECIDPTVTISVMRMLNETRKSKIPFLLYADKRHFSITEGAGGPNATLSQNYLQQLRDAGICYVGGGLDTVAEDMKKICEQAANLHGSKAKSSK